MYSGKYQRETHRGRAGVIVLAVLLVTALAVGGTLAYLAAKAAPVKNTFTPSEVTCEVEEEFDGEVKRNVNVKNTGDTEAYVRVKLVTYRANADGQHIGGTAEIPAFTPGENWVKYGDYYYYTLPVAPSTTPAADLIDSITLSGSYSDADGGKQVFEVMAEAIQSGPAEAVGQAWGVSISSGNVAPYAG